MDGLYYGLNHGAMLRKMFPKHLKSPLMIIIWTVIFCLNIVVVVFVQNSCIYNITDFSKEALQKLSYFEDTEIISIADYGSYYVTYQNLEGENRVVRLEMFPRGILKRAKIDKSYDCLAKEDGSIDTVSNTLSDAFWSGNAMAKLVGIYVAIGALMLLIEFYLYGVLHRLFRE